MKKRNSLLFILLAAVMLFTGCSLRTVDQMYAPPRRSEEFEQLQLVIDQAMTGLAYAAPVSGENRQTVQIADLDGDGTNEYILFAKGEGEAPLRIIVFRAQGSAYSQLAELHINGTAFDRVEYVDMDGRPGLEIVVGSQLSDQVMRLASVYSFGEGEAKQVIITQYFRFLTCDLDSSGLYELMVLLPAELNTGSAAAVLYSFQDGTVVRSAAAELSRPAESVKRIMVNRLQSGANAVYVASIVDESTIVTDVFAMKDGRFSNISFSEELGTSVNTLRNYYVYADDIDNDGVLELPDMVYQDAITGTGSDRLHLIRWFSLDLDGGETDKLHTFHNFPGAWYVSLDSQWARELSVVHENGSFTFYVPNDTNTDMNRLFSVHVLTGKDREEAALIENRFVLHRTESVVYAAKLDAFSVSYGITQDSLINSFHLIHQDWNTGET